MVDYGWGPVTGSAHTVPSGPPRKNEPAAIIAFVLALATPVTWGASGLVAIVMAHVARKSIAVDPTRRKGRGLTIAAQIIAAFLIAGMAAGAVLLATT